MYKILEELLKEEGISAYKLAQETGVSTATLTSWKQGKYTPKREKLQVIANHFGVTVDYLCGKSEFRTEQEEMLNRWNIEHNAEELSDEVKKIEAGIRIPVLGHVAAGIPLEAIEDVLDWEEIPIQLAQTGRFFGLKIKGDSMSPRIQEDDVVIVKIQPDAESGDIVIAKVNGDDGCCKRLIKHDEGVTLQSLNPNYEPMYFNNQEVIERPVTIIGKVVELRGKF